MSLAERIRHAFSQAPASFVFEPDARAVSDGRGATLQIKSDTEAALVVTLPRNDDTLFRRNINLLLLMLLASGWTSGSNLWLTARLKAAGRARVSQDAHIMGRVRYTLTVDRENGLITLQVREV